MDVACQKSRGKKHKKTGEKREKDKQRASEMRKIRIERERQTDKQTEIQIDRKTDKTDRLMNLQIRGHAPRLGSGPCDWLIRPSVDSLTIQTK